MPGTTRFKSSPKPLKPISKIVLLVHPLFSLRHSSAMKHGLMPGTPLSDSFPRKNVNYLLGRWGEELLRASIDPTALVVFVNCADPGTGALSDLVRQKLDRFIQFARKQLGNRLIEENNTITLHLLRDKIVRRGLRLSSKWSGRAFGEYINRCVDSEAIALEHALKGFPENFDYYLWSKRRELKGLKPRVEVVPELSLRGINYGLTEHLVNLHHHVFTMGSMHDVLRKSASKIRKRSRKK